MLKRRIWMLAGLMMGVCSYPMAFGDWVSPLNAWTSLCMLGTYACFYVLQKNSKMPLRFAWSYWFIINAGVLYWVVISMYRHGGLSLPLSVGALFGLSALRASFFMLAFWAWRRFSTPRNSVILGATLFTLSDLLLHYFPLQGFPWYTPAYGLASQLWLVQTAQWWGIHGINWAFHAWVIAACACALKASSRKLPEITPKGIILAVTALGWIAIGGWLAHHWQSTDKPSMHVGVIQGNIPQAMKWDRTSRAAILDTYQTMTQTLQDQQDKPLDLIIWPEAALPTQIHYQQKNLPSLSGLVMDSPLLLGVARKKQADQALVFYNSAVVMQPNHSISYGYDKIRLVPFGEFFPTFGIPALKKWFSGIAGSFAAGTSWPVAVIGTQKLGVSICYEILFGAHLRPFFQNGATFIVNMTNDAWFEKSSAPYQHARFPQVRSIEYRKPIVRVANTGISAVYTPDGGMHDATALFTTQAKVFSFTPNTYKTLYQQWPWLIYAWMVATLGFCVYFKKTDAS